MVPVVIPSGKKPEKPPKETELEKGPQSASVSARRTRPFVGT
jgi:hypothetical protein